MSKQVSQSTDVDTVTHRYARTPEAAQYIKVSTSTLNKARLSGDGPPFIRMGGTILYDLSAVDLWLAARTRRSTTKSASEARSDIADGGRE